VEKIALQMYSLRTLPQDLMVKFEQVAAQGFDGVELAGGGDYTPAQIREKLDKVGLVCAGSHTGYDLLKNDLDTVIANHKILGADSIVCPGFHPAEGEAFVAAWKRVAAEFNEIGKKVADAGMWFGYHNHSFEFERKEGTCAEEILFDNTDPQYVKMQLDTCWVENAGCKAVDYMNKYPNAAKLLHIKELTAVGDPAAKPVGTGCIDFPSIVQLAKKLGVKWYTIEHEGEEGDILGDIKQGLDYLRSIT